MYNSWARSTLRMPNGAESAFVCAPPYHAVLFSDALLVIPKENNTGYILNVSSTEPHLATSFELPSPEIPIADIAWGPNGRIYLLRINKEESKWRMDTFQLRIDSGPSWQVRQQESYTYNNFLVTSFAVQSRLGGVILGTSTGELFQKDDGISPRPLGKWCEGEIATTKVKRDRLVACVSIAGELSLALAASAPNILELCENDSVSTVSFSHELPALAVGLANGPPRIRLFEYGWDSNRVVATPTRELVIFGPYLAEEERWFGGVKDLDFGTGSSIACIFYGRSEPIVFHATSGRRTTTGSANNKSRSGLLPSSPAAFGASPVAVSQPFQTDNAGSKNHSLTWSGNSLFYLNENAEVCRDGFSLHAMQAALHKNDATRFAVLGSDYCSLLNLEGNPRWTRLDCPSEYVSRQSPLVKIAIDDDRSRIAVAGRRGYCVFFSQSRKWKVFQNESLENRLIVGGLFWVPSTPYLCVVASVNEVEWEFQLHDMTEKRLDIAPVFCSGALRSGLPIAVEFVQNKPTRELIALFHSGIQVYDCTDPEFRPVTFVARPPPSELGFITHMVLAPSKLESVLPRCVLLDSAGKSCVVSLETSESFPLSSTCRVADAWTKTDPTLGVLIWTVVDGGLKLWVPSLDPSGELFKSPIVDISFPEIGSLPIGSDEDAFICFQSHSYDIRASKSPLLHGILGWLLRRGRDGLARRVLAERRFSKSVRLVRAALEDLLQGALLGENHVDVRKIVNLLGCVPFEMMAAVVARCARQIDPELWEVLFSIVGAPRDLFEQCLIRFDSSHSAPKRTELILIAAELLPVVDADKDDPQEGPVLRAKQVIRRCERGGTLEREVYDYARKRGLDISFKSDEDYDDDYSNDSGENPREYYGSNTKFLNGELESGGEEEEEEGGGGVVSSVLKFLSGF